MDHQSSDETFPSGTFHPHSENSPKNHPDSRKLLETRVSFWLSLFGLVAMVGFWVAIGVAFFSYFTSESAKTQRLSEREFFYFGPGGAKAFSMWCHKNFLQELVESRWES